MSGWAGSGREQEIEIGPMSGRSNVQYWMDRRGIPRNEALEAYVLNAAKKSRRVFTEDEVRELIHSYSGAISSVAVTERNR